RNLFALNIAKSTKEERLLLAEGYMDVIALHQAGFENAVATLGTALTDEQARLMSQYAKQIIIAYDSDGPGQTATKRAINIFNEIGLQVKVLSMQGAKDPDEFIKKFGRDRFRLLIEGSANALEFELQKIRSQFDLSTSDGKVAYLKEFASYIAGIKNPIERDVYIARTAGELEVGREAIASQVDYIIRRRTRAKEKKDARELRVFAAGPADPVNPERGKALKAALAEERLIAILLKNPDYCSFIRQRIGPQDFVTEFNRRVFERVCGRIENNESLDLGMFGDEFDDAQISRIASFLAKADGQNYTREETEDYIKAILDQKLQKTEKDVAQMNDASWSQYISDLAAKKK
ncbi:toprim domain-containing protein, partial [Ligaoa zhengdingensis]